jgi:phosphomannomutase
MSITITADYKSAFKQADIRGVYPSEIDEEVTYLVARAFVDEFGLKKVVVGRDMRLSTPVLFAAFCKGIQDAGADVVDLGMVPTPLVYFASGSLKLPGVMITASHSPKYYNGLKLVLAGAIPLTEKHGLRSIRKRIEKGVFIEAAKRGKVVAKDVRPAYQKYIWKGFKVTKLPPLSIAVDCGNGMGSEFLPLWSEKLPDTFTGLFTELDGRFPNRGSDPTLKKNQRAITSTVAKGVFDLGIALDGDADRIAFFDENGVYVNSAIIGALVAKQLLLKKPGARIVYTTLTSRVLEEEIKSAEGVPVIARVGHAFIKEVMREKDVLFGAEHSGHFYFKDFFYTDSVTLTLQAVLAAYGEAKANGKTFSEYIQPYRRYEQTDDTIVMVEEPVEALETVREFLVAKKPIKMKKFDGYSVDFGDVWGSVKVSVTEPALKLMFEGNKKKQAVALLQEVEAFILTLPGSSKE